MSGNVWEWSWDFMGNFKTESTENPMGDSSGNNRVMRGGSWSDGKKDIRSSSRGDNEPNARLTAVGIRVGRSY